MNPEIIGFATREKRFRGDLPNPHGPANTEENCVAIGDPALR